MASLLRQIVAGPRARHPEAGLDLCYVTENIIATSGPSGTYPQRYYRNPLDSLVKFLDSKHGQDWAIWEFRAEGTGYPDEHVYGRVYHYPFPDHHPPPFALIPHMMASMRNWLHEKNGRVVVVHCKAGKGRSGTASCSYLISEEGWAVDKALKRFTERRMRPNMGKGVSIPSQLRWIGYVDRWTKHGKIYVERQVEILEVHCWGLRDGVKLQIEGFVNDGKLIKTFHTFTKEEREVVRGEVRATGMAQAVSEVMYKNGMGKSSPKKDETPVEDLRDGRALKDASTFPLGQSASLDGASSSKDDYEQSELGTGDVVFRPSKRVVLPTNDINIDVERRNRAAFDLTMVTAVAHVWINAFFEGNGPEQDGVADDSGVFEITWDAMDGIKGSSRKGTQAFEKIAVLWKALKTDEGKPGIVINEPKVGEEVKQTAPANWKGEDNVAPEDGKDLGLRTSSPTASKTNISNERSVHSKKEKGLNELVTSHDRSSQEGATKGVKALGPNGVEIIKEPSSASSGSGSGLGGQTGSSISPTQFNGIAPVPSSVPSQGQATQEMENLPQVQSPASDTSGISGIISGVQHVSTNDLPDGKPEGQMKTAKEHTIGHLSKKDTDV
ncbi:phosphatidylinositol-3,4,5-trisphosphate 3-phosphatase [Pleomassaria siparia CBS 279.74]|uniref:phosphatidylinositol-3,4,5-trisphosphate 3-phosphatase n=1 Tax=Pleomassaria siparia CBS 279.74 TaxID=1314801 RepID=A0A6G1KKG9_9PLEO|nr:phosphatidylinositol-3,4,5-trisphosphate 3-phosphatase [Pleomassaria siparia CBS 279.74]